MRALLRDWDALFAELGTQVGGQTTRARTYYARASERFRPQWEQAERALVELRDAPIGAWRRRTPELQRQFDDLRDMVAAVRVE